LDALKGALGSKPRPKGRWYAFFSIVPSS